MNKQERIEALSVIILKAHPMMTGGECSRLATIAVEFMDAQYAELVEAARDVERLKELRKKHLSGKAWVSDNHNLSTVSYNLGSALAKLSLSLNNLKEPSHD